MRTTGWPPGLLQDDDRGLSRWFASRPDARYQLRKTMTTQPEALRLAELCEGSANAGSAEPWTRRQAAAELRRLHQSEREAWRYADELEQSRKALLEALERLVGMAETFSDELHKDHPDVVDARAAIAKHGGKHD